MKIYTNKKNDIFYIPVLNYSCLSEEIYNVRVSDPCGVLSLENTESVPGAVNNLYITVPPIANFGVEDGTLVATCSNNSGSKLYYLEIHVPNYSKFIVYEEDTVFNLFTSDGSGVSIPIRLVGSNGQFPKFSVDQYSLLRLLNGNLPAPNTQSIVQGKFFITRDEASRNYLKVVTTSKSNEEQYAYVALQVVGGASHVYEFYVNTEVSSVIPVAQPPIGSNEEKTVQLARAFVPVSGVSTLQVDSEGKLYMNKLSSSSINSQMAFKRRCTNLGYEKDLANFFSYLPKDSIFSLNSPDEKYSSSNFKDQYYTDLNSGVEKSHYTKEGMKVFAPLWIKGSMPKYFAIFRRPVDKVEGIPLDGASLVKLIDIGSTELGSYMNNLVSNKNFHRPPLEIGVVSNYSATWNGISTETGDWTSHTEFLGSEIQSGLSDFEFNDLVTSGFQRGSVVCPQFMNIEFLFDDVQAKPYEVYQYFGLYCNTLNMGSFLADMDMTKSLFSQEFSRISTTGDTNDSVVTNESGVGLVLTSNRTIEGRYISRSSDQAIVSGETYALRHFTGISQESTFSKRMVATIHTSFDPEVLKSAPFSVRLETEDGSLVEYVDVTSCEYDTITGISTLKILQNDVYSSNGKKYFIRFFDFSPDPTTDRGSCRLDSPKPIESGCIVLSSSDIANTSTIDWASKIPLLIEDFRESTYLIDKSTRASLTFVAKSVVDEIEYVKVFFDVLETSGYFSDGGTIAVDSLASGNSSIFPSKSLVESKGRKFVLKTKNDWHSIKTIDIIDSGETASGIITLDSKVVNLDGIAGSVTQNSAHIEIVKDFTSTIQINSYGDTIAMDIGDKFILERKIGDSRKRWSIIASEPRETSVSVIGGFNKDVPVTLITSTDKYTSVDFSVSNLHPLPEFQYTLIGGTLVDDVRLDFVKAESISPTTCRVYFSNTNLSTTYTKLYVECYDSKVSFVDCVAGRVRLDDVVTSIQRFQDSPFRASIDSSSLCLYLSENSGECSLIIVSQYGTVSGIDINGRRSIQSRIFVGIDDIVSPISTHYFDRADIAYSVPKQYASLFNENTKILPVSGAYITPKKWSNGQYYIPDALAQSQGRGDNIIISLPSTPYSLNGRIQILENSGVSISLLSFFRYVDLDFFEELPFSKEQGNVVVKSPDVFLGFSALSYADDPLYLENDTTYDVILKKRSGITKETSTKNMTTSVSTTRGKTRPVVGRWKRVNSTNSDFMPYTLNVDPLQLEYDRFTGVSYKTLETEIFPLDFYIISGWPKSATTEDEYRYDYLGRRIDIELLKSNKYDHFSDYFTVGEGKEVFLSGNSRGLMELWTTISSDGEGGYSTMFKGLPITLNSSIDLSGYKFAAVLQVERELDSPRKIDFIVNEVWNCITLVVRIAIDGSTIDGSITFDELYNLAFNTAKSTYGVLKGGAEIYANNEYLSFDKVTKVYNKKNTTITNTPYDPTDAFDKKYRYDGFRQYDYKTALSLETDHYASTDIELFGVEYVPKSDYIINADIYVGTENQSNVTISIPKSRIRGVYDPVLKRTRVFIDGAFGDSFFGIACDTLTGPMPSTFTFSDKNLVVCNGSIRLFGQKSNPVDVSGIQTKLVNPRIYVIGDEPVYPKLIASCSAKNIFDSIANKEHTDTLIVPSGDKSKSNITISYGRTIKLKPLSFKTSELDNDGNIVYKKIDNPLNIFRIDGGFEPSFKDVILFSAAENPLLTRQIFDSLKGYNTNIIGVKDIGIWYRKISESPLDSSVTTINGERVNVDKAISRKKISIVQDTWGDSFYSKALDKYIDVPVNGMVSMSGGKYFLSSKEMNLPSFVRSYNYTIGDPNSNASVRYVSTSTSLTVEFDISKIISDELFSAGVFSFFESISPKVGTYSASEEYIKNNLLNAYRMDYIEVFVRQASVTEVISSGVSPESITDFVKMDEIKVNDNNTFVITTPIDGSKQVCFAFNINRI